MWRSVCCAVQGTGHKRDQIPCQDKTLSLEKNGVFVIALADGAGSARLSHYGAERVVKTASEYIADHFLELLNSDDGREVKKTLVDTLQTNLADEANIRECNILDLSSTLLLVAVRDKHFILTHIGDGVIGYLDGGELKVASTPDNGEFTNVTTFVTSKDALASMRLFKGELKEKDAFVLMSDGTEQSLYHKPSKSLASVVKKLMHRTCLIDGQVMKTQLEDAFTSVISRNTQDDCSIAILARPSKNLCQVNELAFWEKLDLYTISEKNSHPKRSVSRYDSILAITDAPCSLNQIGKALHLKPKHCKKYADKLVTMGLLKKNRGLYQKAK